MVPRSIRFSRSACFSPATALRFLRRYKLLMLACGGSWKVTVRDSLYLKLRLFSLALVVALPVLPASAKGGSPAAPTTWVELGESGAVIARQAIPLGPTGLAKACPAIQIVGVSNPPTAMTPRTPSPAGFPVLLCEVAIPSGATSATVNGVSLPLPKSTINNIVVIGDTGCKGDVTGTGKKVEPLEEPEDDDDAEEAAAARGSKKPQQDCTPTGWPFKAVSKSAAATAPDLVIHVGDYVYVKGDTWENWNDQFFTPAKKLLSAAPWIFVRGNHEICDTKFHGAGFFYLLDPRPLTNPCPGDSTAPWLANAGGAKFVVMDSSGATCDLSPAGPAGTGSCTQSDYNSQVATWTPLFTQAKSLVSSGSAMLLSHRPIFGAKPATTSAPPPAGYCSDSASAKSTAKGGKKNGDSAKVLLALNSSLQAAWQPSSGAWISNFVSGHVHTFELLTYAGGPPPQVLVGDSGVKLSSGAPNLSNCKLQAGAGSLPLSTLNGLKQWGYGVLKSQGTKMDVYLSSGKRALKCDIGATSAKCK